MALPLVIWDSAPVSQGFPVSAFLEQKETNMIVHRLTNHVKPGKQEEAPLREPKEIIAEIVALDVESAKILKGIRGIL